MLVKDEFYLKLPHSTVSDAPHLPARCAQLFAGDNKLQKPVNPHSQRLLAASKRAAKVETKSGGDKDPKAKAKAKKAPKQAAKPKIPKVEKATPTLKQANKDVKEAKKNEYMTAKETFMWTFFGMKKILFIQWLNFKLFSWLGSRARAPSVSVLEPIKGARARTQPRKKFKLFPIRTLAELEMCVGTITYVKNVRTNSRKSLKTSRKHLVLHINLYRAV